ncbi:MAG: hypothetical protein WDM94_08030 [Bauldia sp.]
MTYVFGSIMGVFVGSAWDIANNHGYWINILGRGVLHAIKAVGLA